MIGLAGVIFIICVSPTWSQQCIRVDVPDVTYVGESTELMCTHLSDVNNKLQMTWRAGGNIKYTVQWYNGDVYELPSPGFDGSGEWDEGNKQHILTISSTTLEDEAFWVSTITADAPCSGESESAFLTVNVRPSEPIPNGLQDSWVNHDLQYRLECVVDIIKPEGSIYWRLGGQLKTQGRTKAETNPDGKTSNLVGTYTAQFPQDTNLVSVDCVVTEKNLPDEILTVKHYKDVEVRWKAVTQVINATNTAPKEGDTYSLKCDVVDGNPAPTVYRWEGQGETGDELHIASLDREQHSKTFHCAADSAVGNGEYGTGLPVIVWYKPEVAITGPSGPAVEGYSAEIDCEMTDGYPHLGQVSWQKNGAPLEREDVDGGDLNSPGIKINGITKHDKGNYVCILTNGAGTTSSSPFNLDVNYKPVGQPDLSISTGARTQIAVNEEVTFSCDQTGDSNPFPTHFTFAIVSAEFNTSLSTSVPQTWDNINDGGNVRCSTSNNVGNSQYSNEIIISIEASATIEEFPASSDQSPVYDDPDFFLDCLGAGNERTVTWTKDGSDLSDDDYVDAGSRTENGVYSFGQTQAFNRRYKWRTPGPDATCDSVKRHNGKYTCEVRASAGGQVTAEKRDMQVTVQYPPLPVSGYDFDEKAAEVGDDVTFSCYVCSYPEEGTYEWRFNDAVIGTHSEFTITNIQDVDYGNYTCLVFNTINQETRSRSLVFALQPRGGPKPPLGLTLMEPTSQTVNVTFTPNFNGGLPQTFTVEYKLASDPDTNENYIQFATDIVDPNPVKFRQKVPVTIRITDLQEDQQYTFRVQAENEFEDDSLRFSAWSQVDGSTLNRPIVSLLSLSYIQPSFDRKAHISIIWLNQQGSPSFLSLQYRLGVSATNTDGETWKPMVDDLLPHEEIYYGETDVILDPASDYIFRLLAFEGDIVTEPPSDGYFQRTAAGGSGGLTGGEIAGFVVGYVAVFILGLIIGVNFMRNRTQNGHSRNRDSTECDQATGDPPIYINILRDKGESVDGLQNDGAAIASAYEDLEETPAQPQNVYDRINPNLMQN